MGIIKLLAPVALAGMAAVSLASPAAAYEFDGTYTMDMGGPPSTWTVRPCVSDPDNQPFIPCVRISESGGKYAPWEGEALLSVGSWTMHVDRPDAITCDDGSTHPSKVTYSWDAVTLEGTLGFYFPGGCGDAPAKSLSAPFRLTKYTS